MWIDRSSSLRWSKFLSYWFRRHHRLKHFPGERILSMQLVDGCLICFWKIIIYGYELPSFFPCQTFLWVGYTEYDDDDDWLTCPAPFEQPSSIASMSSFDHSFIFNRTKRVVMWSLFSSSIYYLAHEGHQICCNSISVCT